MDDVRQSHVGTCLTISHERFAETWEYLTRDTALPAAIDEQSDARGGLDSRLGRWQIFRSVPVNRSGYPIEQRQEHVLAI